MLYMQMNYSIKIQYKGKGELTKHFPLNTERKLEEKDDDYDSGLLTGCRIQNMNNDDIFAKKIKKLYKKSRQFSKIHNNSSNLINISKNESSSIIVNKFN